MNQPEQETHTHTTWGLVRDLKCILRFLVDSNGTTTASYRGRTIGIS